MNTSSRFYLGTLISSVGSMTLTVCLIAAMIEAGYAFTHVGFLIGAGRLLPVLVNLLIGDLADRHSPKRLILGCELLGAVLAIGLYWSWSLGPSHFQFFFVFFLIRTSILSMQVGARSRVAKQLSEPGYESNSRNAIWLNKVSQGATIFAGLLGWAFISYSDFTWVIGFDAATFLINGMLLWNLPLAANPSPESRFSPLTKFRLLYRFSAVAALQDAFLAVVMMGAGTFNARLADVNQKWTALFLASYGIAVWTTGFLERWHVIKKQYAAVWVMFGVSYAALGLCAGQGWLTWGISLLKDSCYWIIFHRLSSQIQFQTPVEHMAAVSSARMVQMVLILATGELLVGLWKTSLPIEYDGWWRAVLAITVGVIISLRARRQKAFA